MAKPNILLLMTDQQRADAMGCTGGWVETPNMDRIANEGVRFSNCVTNSPICVPARLSLATGHYPHNTGVWNHQDHTLSTDAKTWIQVVRSCGYRTSLFGKTHLHPTSGDLRSREHLLHAYGLDDVNEIGGPRACANCVSHMTSMWEKKGLWEKYKADLAERSRTKRYLVRPSAVGLEDYYDVYVGQQAKGYLESYDRSEPWFCWVSFGGPHMPYDTPEPYASKYHPGSMPSPVPYPEDERKRPRGTLDDILDNRPTFDPGEEKILRADYAGNVTLIDDQIGEILLAIEARGELDDTVILLVSDHGEMNGDCGILAKSNFMNGAVRVPLVIRTPDTVGRSAAGKTCASHTEWFDAGPTLAELAGGEIEYPQFAKSLCPMLADPSIEHRSEAISEYGGDVMLLNHDWKIALNKEGEAYLLFDVKNDPSEVNNLAGRADMADVENSLKLRILERMMESQVYTGARFAG